MSLVACAECCTRSQDWDPSDIHTVSFHDFCNIKTYKGWSESDRTEKVFLFKIPALYFKMLSLCLKYLSCIIFFLVKEWKGFVS